MPQQSVYGPKVVVSNTPQMTVATSRTYDSRSEYRLWSGMLTIFFDDRPLFDIEAAVVKGRSGPFLSLPQREYEGRDGEKRYKSLVWSHDDDFQDAALQAVREDMSGGQPAPMPPVADEDLPF